MKSYTDFKYIIDQIEFRDWRVQVIRPSHSRGNCLLQVRFQADGKEWGGRKWYLSPYMTYSEVVQTALAAVLAAVEHEAREHFLYRGRAIFGPHFNVARLIELVDLGAVDMRENVET